MKKYIKADIYAIDDEDQRSKRRIARDPDTSIRVLYKLASEFDYEIISDMITNPSIPAELLHYIVDNYISNLRVLDVRDIIINPNTSADTLRLLFNKCDPLTHYSEYDRDMIVQCFLHNPNLPYDLRNELQNYESEWVDKLYVGWDEPMHPVDIEDIISTCVEQAGYAYYSGFYADDSEDGYSEFICFISIVCSYDDIEKIEDAIAQRLEELEVDISSIKFDYDSVPESDIC